MRKTLTALSGGVDSSAAAYLLREAGEAPTAVFLRHSRQSLLDPDETERFWSESPENRTIPVQTDADSAGTETFWNPDLFPLPAEAADAARAARAIGIPFFLYDAEPVFRAVLDNWVSEYLGGRTPNPCVLCNRILKFGSLIRLAKRLGFDQFSTGHYIRVRTHAEWVEELGSDASSLPAWLADADGSQRALLKGHDLNKDQSYVLYGIPREHLPFLRFPLAELTKPEVRQITADAGVPAAVKKESQDLCFTNEAPAEFLHEIAGPLDTAGNFVSLSGETLGKHPGYERYTVGQRKGLGIGFGERVFVQRIDAARREVVLGSRDDLARKRVAASQPRWLLDVPLEKPFRAEVKIRYRSPAVGAELFLSSGGVLTADMDEPRYGVAPGQSLVCYWRGRLLGGGVITGAPF